MSEPSDLQLLQIKVALEKVKDFLSSGGGNLGEADTRVHFIDPLVAALGYTSIADVVREQYIQDSNEKLDYMMRIEGQPRLAVEAKSLDHNLTSADAAQVIQYCSVLGIEWGVVTNGVEWWLYDQFKRADLAGKLVFKLDLVGWTTDDEFQLVAGKLLLVSKRILAGREGFDSENHDSKTMTLDASMLATHKIREMLKQRTQRQLLEFGPNEVEGALSLAHERVRERIVPLVRSGMRSQGINPRDLNKVIASVYQRRWVPYALLNDALKELGFKPQEIKVSIGEKPPRAPAVKAPQKPKKIGRFERFGSSRIWFGENDKEVRRWDVAHRKWEAAQKLASRPPLEMIADRVRIAALKFMQANPGPSGDK